MKLQFSRNTSFVLVIIICLYLVFSNFHFQVGQIISYDVYGYYLYLPLTFIYDDLGMQNYELIHALMDTYDSSDVFYQGHLTESGNYVMKYTMGQSFLYAPFFFIGHLISSLTHYPSDGFSKPYEMSVFVGGIIYTLIGVYFFFKLLLHFFEHKIALIVFVITVFGTNYLLHNTMFSQNLMTHNTLFTCYAIILWLTIQWHQRPQTKTIVYLAMLCGLAILIRPTEIVSLFIPLLWGIWNKESFKDKIALLKQKKKQLIFFSLVLFTVTVLQLIYFKIYTGSFFYSEYSGNNGEGLDLFPPHTLKTLFSFRKGWLIYTPIMIFALIGFHSIYKRNRPIFWSLITYFLFNLWFVSSWSNWWYAGSFSQRALIPSYVILGISLGYFINHLKELKLPLRSVVILIIVFFVSLNLFQTNQYRLGILHPDRMTKAYYLKTFGSLQKDPEAQKLLLFDRYSAYVSGEIDENHVLKSKYNQFFESVPNTAFSSDNAHSGKSSEIISLANPYSQGITIPYSKLTDKEHVWLKISAWIYSEVDNQEQQFYLAAHAEHKGKVYQYGDLNSKTVDIPRNKWTKISFNYLTPPIRRSYNEIKANLWFKSGTGILIDDLTMEVWESQED